LTSAFDFAEWALFLTTGFAILYALASLAGSKLDARTLAGENVWLKPLKFGLSAGLYVGTLFWAMSSFSPAYRDGTTAFLVAATASLCTLFGIIYIGIQAARGQASHFNVTTPFYSTMYSLMAVAAVGLVLSGAALGTMAIVDKAAAFSRPIRWSVGVGFPLSSLLTLLTALPMGGRRTHHVGLEPASAQRLPLFGWSLTVGDMRVPHFLATHLMQAAPLFAWVVIGVVDNDRVATGAVLGFCFAGAAFTLWIFRIVLAGRPFFTFAGRNPRVLASLSSGK
jgi:hypothetical protein